MPDYYSNKLNAGKLLSCYEVAQPRIQQFLEAEIEYVLSKIKHDDHVLDLGCGYGRVAVRLAKISKHITGIDISDENINLAKELYGKKEGLQFFEMDAIDLAFQDEAFDVTICIQNGISAFRVDPFLLIYETLRVTKKGGLIIFSSYSEKIWDERLRWFELQAENGLIGEIDYEQTGDGIISCKDGFKAVTYSENDFINLLSGFGIVPEIREIDSSSLFCEFRRG